MQAPEVKVSDAEATPSIETRASSINRALDQIGDMWTILILQEIFWGINTFGDMLAATGASRGILSNRLEWLQQIECLKKAPSPDARVPRLSTHEKINGALRQRADGDCLGAPVLLASTTR